MAESIQNGMKKAGQLAVKGAESKTVRIIWWILVGVITAIMINLSLVLLILALTGVFDWIFLRDSAIMLSIVISLTNVFIIFRSEHQAYDPWIDLRHHARIRTKLGNDESEFMIKFHRVGYPDELSFSFTNTLNMIEQSVPNILLFTSSGIFLSVLAFTSIYIRFTSYSIRLNDFINFCFLLLTGCFLIYFIVHRGVFQRWKNYRTWKEFWISYWEFVLNKMESNPYASDVPDCIGDWRSLVGWKWWGEKVDLDNPDFVRDLRHDSGKIIKKLGLSDALPTDTQELMDYCDILALFHDIKDYLKKNKDDIAEVVKKSNDYKDIVDRLSSLSSLMGITHEYLRISFSILNLLPVVILSIEAFNEVLEVSNARDEDRNEIYEIAKDRLDVFWFLSGSPIPDSLKWTTVFYSVASLVTTWLSPLMS
ncbi:MAG: hypothetical protein ACTSV2_12445 [Candidatus Thorarchaeota archaeon]